MKCPMCKQEQTPEYKPFCSKICKDRDLLNWLNEAYYIPEKEKITEEDEDV